MTTWNWHEEGFRHPPRKVFTQRALRLYRVWGGAASMRGRPTSAGVFFSLDQPRSRWHAEQLFSVFEWGNTCLYLAEFEVPPAVPIWMGSVHPGEALTPLGLAESGTQILIESPLAQTLRLMDNRCLCDDLSPGWISPVSGQT